MKGQAKVCPGVPLNGITFCNCPQRGHASQSIPNDLLYKENTQNFNGFTSRVPGIGLATPLSVREIRNFFVYISKCYFNFMRRGTTFVFILCLNGVRTESKSNRATDFFNLINESIYTVEVLAHEVEPRIRIYNI